MTKLELMQQTMKDIQHGLLEHGVSITVQGAGFISTVTTTQDLDDFADALMQVLAARAA